MARGWNTLTLVWATGLGFGFSRLMPGTVGALWGLPVTGLAYGAIDGWPWRAVLLVALVVVGVPVCQRAAEQLGEHDPSQVVWDEIASLPWVYCWLSPDLVCRRDTLLAGFLLHRLFDILKPPPLGWLEKFPGGIGIMADDLGAAVYAGVVLYFVTPLWTTY
jgi:phosphatidylglycerophosphatase A